MSFPLIATQAQQLVLRMNECSSDAEIIALRTKIVACALQNLDEAGTAIKQIADSNWRNSTLQFTALALSSQGLFDKAVAIAQLTAPMWANPAFRSIAFDLAKAGLYGEANCAASLIDQGSLSQRPVLESIRGMQQSASPRVC